MPVIFKRLLSPYEIAMAAHWRAIGILPEIIVGHSCGEYAAAVIAGFYTIEQMMPLLLYIVDN